MKLFVVAFCVAVCSAAKLDNTYLPPGSAHSAGGSGSFLSAPRGGSGFGGGGSFGGKTTFGGGAAFGSKHSFSSGNFGGGAAAPAQNYGAPAGGNFRAGGGGHSAGPQIPIVRFNNENNGDGTYRFEYETGNGIQAQEAGQQKGGGQEEINDVHGSFAYTGDDGQQYSISYVADENGFQPQGAHLPTPPPIPEEILKSLQDNAADEARGISDDGSYNAGAHGGAGGAGGYGGGHGGAAGGYGSSNRGGSAHGSSSFGGAAHGSSSFGGAAHGSSSFGGSFGSKSSGFGNAGGNRQYLAPNKPSFNAKSGYNY